MELITAQPVDGVLSGRGGKPGRGTRPGKVGKKCRLLQSVKCSADATGLECVLGRYNGDFTDSLQHADSPKPSHDPYYLEIKIRSGIHTTKNGLTNSTPHFSTSWIRIGSEYILDCRKEQLTYLLSVIGLIP